MLAFTFKKVCCKFWIFGGC